MPLGIVMASVSKSSTFIVSKNGQKLLELKTREVGDVQVVNLFEKKPQESIDVFVEKLLIQPTTGAMKLHTHVVKCAENLLRLLLTFNANTNVLNFVIPDPVLPVQPVFYKPAHVGKQAKMVDAELLPYAKTSVDVF